MLRIESTGLFSRTILTYNQYLHKIYFQLLSVGRDVLLSETQIVLTFIIEKMQGRFNYKHLLGFYGDISIHQRYTKSLFHELTLPFCYIYFQKKVGNKSHNLTQYNPLFNNSCLFISVKSKLLVVLTLRGRLMIALRNSSICLIRKGDLFLHEQKFS